MFGGSGFSVSSRRAVIGAGTLGFRSFPGVVVAGRGGGGSTLPASESARRRESVAACCRSRVRSASWVGVSTRAKTQPEGRNGGPHKYVHFTFEHDRVVIDHYAPARYKLRWIFAVERHDRDED